MKKMLFLVNPNSGKAEIRQKLVEVLDTFIKGGYEVTVHITQRGNEIPEIIKKRADNFDMIVCSGGDGTFNETVTGIMQLGKKIPLGYIPSGTVNDFATSLEIPKNIQQAADIIIKGKSFLCDVGKFDDRYFSYIAAFGVFTDVSYTTSQYFKNLFGKAAYILEGIRTITNIKSYEMTVESENMSVTGEFIFGMVTNSFSIAGIKSRMIDNVLMNDGLLEVLFVRKPQTPLDIQIMINDILMQKFSEEYFLTFKAKEIKIASKEKISWTLDGEFGGEKTQVNITNQKQALDIIVGKG